MKHTVSRLAVISSLLAGLLGVAGAATRPHYGGTLHVAVRNAPASLDPAEIAGSGSLAGRNIARLLFDTLVTLDERGTPQPALAVSWESDSNNRRWQFRLRRDVTFQGGAALSPEAVAASLRLANPGWQVFSAEDAVVIQIENADPDLPAELALARNSIVRREGGKLTGTGPFFVTQWDAGKYLALAARDDYWNGRAFVDAVDFEFGKSPREQLISLELRRTQLVDLPPGQAHAVAAEGRAVETSPPVELLALRFARDPQSGDESKLRDAFRLSIDRRQLDQVILQGAGEPTGALLPEWMSGYGFLFPVETNLQQARQIAAQVRKSPAWTLAYDATDPVSRLVAERLVLNAKDAGIALQLSASDMADARLVRIPIASLDRAVALTNLAAALGLPQPSISNSSTEGLYSAERTLLQSQRVIPLLHLSAAWVLDASVKNWSGGRDGNWDLPDLWLAAP